MNQRRDNTFSSCGVLGGVSGLAQVTTLTSFVAPETQWTFLDKFCFGGRGGKLELKGRFDPNRKTVLAFYHDIEGTGFDTVASAGENSTSLASRITHTLCPSCLFGVIVMVRSLLTPSSLVSVLSAPPISRVNTGLSCGYKAERASALFPGGLSDLEPNGTFHKVFGQ